MYNVYFEESKQLFIFFTPLTLEEICQFLTYVSLNVIYLRLNAYKGRK